MASYDGFILPLPDFFQQDLTDSLDIDLEPFYPYSLVDVGVPLFGTLTHHGATPRLTRSLAGFVLPAFEADVFGHVLVVPGRLDMGNLLSNQVKTLEIANLFFETRSLEAVVNNAGGGIDISGLPALPYDILPFGNLFITVSVAAIGPPSISGTIDIDLDEGDVSVPVTGQRITLFKWQPEIPVKEVLQSKTDVLTAYDGTEQRHRILYSPRQVISYEVINDEKFSDAEMRFTTFDWLARVWGVPIWWEQRRLLNPAQSGDTTLEVNTRWADFRIGSLLGVFNPVDGNFEAFEIDSFTDSEVVLTSGLVADFPKRATVMPVRTALANTKVSFSRKYNVDKLNITFTTLDNIDLADTTGQNLYAGKIYLDDYNVANDDLPEGIDRDVTVIDNQAGRVYQISSKDRSTLRSRKQWHTNLAQEKWRIRKLVHAMHGSQKTFFLPSFRPDFTVAQTIGPGATSFRIVNVGYTLYVQSKRPLGDVRFIFKDGRPDVVRRITTSSIDGAEENIILDGVISATAVEPDEVEQVELVSLVRIADDKVTFVHNAAGETLITINLLGVKD